MDINDVTIEKMLGTVRESLLASLSKQGFCKGRLSSSALATATSVFALTVVDKIKYQSLVEHGLDWLGKNQNSDGGWGDTILSTSNISTTMLCWSALTAAQEPQKYEKTTVKLEAWLKNYAGSLEPEKLVQAIYNQYGKDRTFSVPILTMCAIAGKLGDTKQAWSYIKPLPFELAALPHQLFRWLRLSVVSYALPALIAMGQANYYHRRPKNPVTGFLRRCVIGRTLSILGRIQPETGGFLEAAPLTSFVVMSLASSGQKENAVVSKGIEFLAASVRDDGSWPIDTNLNTWLTTLSVNALAANPDSENIISAEQRKTIRNWLLSQQYRREHPYTHAAPGGWAWTDLAGGVPDADDTAGALIALHNLNLTDADVTEAAVAGINWLLRLQNTDGGIPTFCRGWTDLPFDRSAPDLTAHAIAAMNIWFDELPDASQKRIIIAIRKAVRYLRQQQNENGSWIPLWFGNQYAPQKTNPVYGTAKVLTALSTLSEKFISASIPSLQKAVHWLLSAQNSDGGWGGAESVASSIEETALGIDALASLLNTYADNEKFQLPKQKIESAVSKAVVWLAEETKLGTELKPSPIGLYFAGLWYFERLYPLIFTVAALQKAR